MASCREASPSLCFRLGTLLPRALTAPQTPRSRARNTRFPRFTRQIRQGLRGARPLLSTRNTEVNKRGAVWALQTGRGRMAGRGCRPQTGRGYPDQGAAGHEGETGSRWRRVLGWSRTAFLGLAWGPLAKTLHDLYMGFPGGSVVKNRPANADDTGSIPELGRSPG